MDVFDGRYYRSCKWFMIQTGLWPYESDSKRRMGHFIWYVVNFTLILPQIIIFVQQWNKSMVIFFESFGSFIFTIACSTKFTVSYFSKTELKSLFEQIAIDWKKTVNESERDILKKYNEQGRNLVIFYTFYVFGAWIIYTLIPFLPYILDKTFPLENGSRPLLMPFYANYVYFEQIEYHYWTCGHGSVVYLLYGFLFAGIDTTYVLTVKHTCGLFAIICYRLQTVVKNNKRGKRTIADFNDARIEENLQNAVILHNETIRCCLLLENAFSVCFFLVQILCIIGISIMPLYMIYFIVDTYILIRILTLFVGVILHILYLNWVGQQIINSSDKLLNSAYFSDWYIISLKSRKLTNIIMIRSLYPCHLTSGKISTLSMESFGVILKTAASYFTVLTSML